MLLDSDVMVDVLRNHPPAVAWLNGLSSTPVSLPGIVAMELLQGCPNLAEQQRSTAPDRTILAVLAQ